MLLLAYVYIKIANFPTFTFIILIHMVRINAKVLFHSK